VDDTAELERLLAEGEAAPVDGWDFAWFVGRAAEQRPSWGYTRTVLPPRLAAAARLLDVQTGGGEVLAEMLTRSGKRPTLVAATEGWPPNVAVAGQHLRPLGASVVEVADGACLPFASGSFDLVTSRHPTQVQWSEIARVLCDGGTYLAQHVGAGSVHELTDFLMGPRPVGRSRDPEHVATQAEAAGLRVADLRSEALRTEFYDIAAVVAFLRKVVWIVPGFTVAGYRDRLAALHEHIRTEGTFVAYAQRFLIEAYRPE
jgi:SAM-dependent methyltransferase